MVKNVKNNSKSESKSKPKKAIMVPTVVLGDIHGLTSWKKIIDDNANYRFVFLGDYLDPFEPSDVKLLLKNLSEIIQLKKSNPDNVILLLGNHDMHYITSDMEPCMRFDMNVYEQANELFVDNFELFQYAFQDGNYLFTHAGVSHEWFANDFHGDILRNIAEQLNNPSDEQIPSLCRISAFFGGYDGSIGGIFWAHIEDLFEPLRGFTQIVGHNVMDEISEYRSKSGNVIFCDALWNGQYLKIENNTPVPQVL
jgi:hypothetical protein